MGPSVSVKKLTSKLKGNNSRFMDSPTNSSTDNTSDSVVTRALYLDTLSLPRKSGEDVDANLDLTNKGWKQNPNLQGVPVRVR